MPKNENYIQICGWMVNELKLKGKELLIYALIYGFSQDGVSEFTGSINYMMDWLGCKSKHTVISTITALIEKGLIEKKQTIINGVTFNKYSANLGSAKNAPLVQKMNAGSAKNALGGSAKNAPNNTKYINTKNNNTRARGNRFNNFEQRDYDFDELTMQLIHNQGM